MSDEEEPRPSGRESRVLFDPGTTVNGYTVISLLGQGGFGDVYKVTDGEGHPYALKTEYKSSDRRALHLETSILLRLNSPRFPKVRAEGETDSMVYIVMDAFGCSLSAIRRAHCSLVPTKTVLFVAIEMLRVIQELHSAGFVHRDIKPSNFLINESDAAPIVLIDFGLACEFRDEQGGHLPQEDGRFFGTKRYASINAFDRRGLSRRDDVISWFYSVAELFAGKLPWTSQSDPEKIREMKAAADARSLYKTSFQPAPRAFVEIWEWISGLGYEDEPNYGRIIAAVREYLRSDFGAGPSDFSWVGFFKVEMKVEEKKEEPPQPEGIQSIARAEDSAEVDAKVACRCAVS